MRCHRVLKPCTPDHGACRRSQWDRGDGDNHGNTDTDMDCDTEFTTLVDIVLCIRLHMQYIFPEPLHPRRLCHRGIVPPPQVTNVPTCARTQSHCKGWVSVVQTVDHSWQHCTQDQHLLQGPIVPVLAMEAVRRPISHCLGNSFMQVFRTTTVPVKPPRGAPLHRGRSGPTIAPLTPMSAVAKALSRRSSNAASVSSRSSEKHPLTVPAVSDSMPHMMLAPKVIKSRCVASGCTTGLDKATSSSNNSRSHRKPFPLEDCCGVKECHLQSGKAMFSLLRTTVRDHIGTSAHGTGDPGSSDRLRTRTQSHRGELHADAIVQSRANSPIWTSGNAHERQWTVEKTSRKSSPSFRSTKD